MYILTSFLATICLGTLIGMATSLDQWTKEFNEASRLSEEISATISERGSLPPSGPETQRQLTAMRRKITILRTRLENLESLLSKLPSLQPMYFFPTFFFTSN